MKEKEYLVSIIIPMYNLEAYISRCIESLIIQKRFEKFQIIIIDDGSTDQSKIICQKYLNRYGNIVYKYQNNSGVSAARNIGIDMSKGNYIFFIDGDDYLDNNKYIYELLEQAQNGNYDLVVGNYSLIWENGKKISYRKNRNAKYYNRQETLKELLIGGNFGGNIFDKLYKTNIVKKVRFDEKFKISEDFYFLYNFAKKSEKNYGLFNDGYCYFQRKNSTMHLSFGDKHFDAIKVADLIRKDITNVDNNLEKYADAFFIYKKYKILERIYKSNKEDEYRKIIKEYNTDIKKYSLVNAYKVFSNKRFFGFVLMKYSPVLYLKICKMMNI